MRPEAEKQQMAPDWMKQRISKITDNWEKVWGAVDPIRKTSAEMYTDLARAGAPCSPGKIGVSPGLIRKALLYTSDIRDRYTILHLARDVGLLHDLADDVFAVFDGPAKNDMLERKTPF